MLWTSKRLNPATQPWPKERLANLKSSASARDAVLAILDGPGAE
jgi:hypothetical protein